MMKHHSAACMLATAVLIAVSAAVMPAASPPRSNSTPNQAHDPEIAKRGLDLMMNGELDASIEVFRKIQKDDPDSPLGYLLEADADWWKIYLTEGNLVDPDVFESVSETITPYDADFNRLQALALQKAESRLHAPQDQAQSCLYEGLAYALRARLEALRDRALATARDGKKMRSLMLNAVKLDPHLSDAYLGIGLYNYFVDTLPGYVKVLRFLILLPGGSREVGLEQLQEAAQKGELTRNEAKFHLAKDYSRPIEHQYAKSLALFQELAADYPRHPLWKLLVGSLEIRLGRPQRGEALYQEVIRETAEMKSDVGQSIHQQAQKALERRHPAL
jgi:tetratricopeptide (TPR) repeat protein